MDNLFKAIFLNFFLLQFPFIVTDKCICTGWYVTVYCIWLISRWFFGPRFSFTRTEQQEDNTTEDIDDSSQREYYQPLFSCTLTNNRLPTFIGVVKWGRLDVQERDAQLDWKITKLDIVLTKFWILNPNLHLWSFLTPESVWEIQVSVPECWLFRTISQSIAQPARHGSGRTLQSELVGGLRNQVLWEEHWRPGYK